MDGVQEKRKKNVVLCLSLGTLDLDLSGPNDLCLHEMRHVAA